MAAVNTATDKYRYYHETLNFFRSSGLWHALCYCTGNRHLKCRHPARSKRVSFESSNIGGVRVHRIHDDGAMTAPSLSMHDVAVRDWVKINNVTKEVCGVGV